MRITGFALAVLAAMAPLPAIAANPQSAPGTRQLALVSSLAGETRPATPADKQQTAYLLAYFKDATHSLYFATSRDGYSFTDVNRGQPVLSGRDVAEQKGIRDPHIMRGPDGAFYLVMTDLDIYGERDGVRGTLWQRPESQYGWGNNRKMVMMKSYDLIHWTHAEFDLPSSFPAYADAGCAWAPETIYDPKAKRMMVYFTTRHGAGPNFMVYSYANAAFTTLTTSPKQLFKFPDPAVNTIDADITKVGSRYHLFYVAHTKPMRIAQGVSRYLNRGFSYDPRKVDPEPAAAEAPNLWRRHGTDKYVLMYDVFGVSPSNMGFAETTDFRTFKSLGRFNEPGSPMKATNFASPKHGAVMAISPAEAKRLQRYFAN